MAKKSITVARGDGIGPEIMDATFKILAAAGAELEIEEVEIGLKAYEKGSITGIDPQTWESIKRTKTLLKAPITTPQGGGFKSLNVTIRTALGLYANIRPCQSLSPFVKTKHPNMNLTIIRENTEDLYTGIEYQQTEQTCHSIKLVSQQACENIIRYAFEYAKAHGKKQVTCMTKDNILKLSDGLFHKTFDRIAQDYPDIENNHYIVDIGFARVADTPEKFDVIVLPNLYGDILSDIAAQIAGSVGLAGSANIGTQGAMFEAIHGSAPDIAGKGIANPSGLLMGAVLMLNHLGQSDVATNIHNAWLKTLEEGIHTPDIFSGHSKKIVGTKEFTESILARLGKTPQTLSKASYKDSPAIPPSSLRKETKSKQLVGVDIYLSAPSLEPLLETIHGCKSPLVLDFISNRGAKVWPEGHAETLCIEQWRCRFLKNKTSSSVCLELAEKLGKHHELLKLELLYEFESEKGLSQKGFSQ